MKPNDSRAVEGSRFPEVAPPLDGAVDGVDGLPADKPANSGAVDLAGDDARGEAADEVLSVRSITKTYGGVVASDQVSFALRRGEILALAGENGAGKSTIIGVMAGARRPDSGEILLAGEPVTFASPADARARGIGVVYQEAALVPHLTVEDNVFLGDEPRSSVTRRVRRGELHRRYLALAESTGIPLDGRRIAASLSIAERQLVQILRVAAADATIVILDEPTAALSPEDRAALFDLLHRMRKERGASFILVSHFLSELEEHCDRAIILRNGQVAGEIPQRPVSARELSRMMARERATATIAVNPGLGELLGTASQDVGLPSAADAVGDSAPTAPSAAIASDAAPASVVLRAAGVLPLGGRAVAPFDLELRAGEIVGLAGLVGSGRTEILRALALGRRTAGSVEVMGRPVRNARQTVSAGLLMLPEDRKSGLQMDWSLWRNVSIASLSVSSRGPLLRPRREKRRAVEFLDRLTVKAASPDAKVSTLSGGNQQKVAFARVLATGAPVALLDEPTHGIDVHTKAEILAIITDLAAAGQAFVVVAAEFGDLLDVCTSILTVHKGAVVRRHELSIRTPTSEELLFEAATGRPIPLEDRT